MILNLTKDPTDQILTINDENEKVTGDLEKHNNNNSSIKVDSHPIIIPSHPYRRRTLGCPCPGISILINHGYLNPKDENDPIHYKVLTKALIDCFNLSRSNALFLSWIAVKMCGDSLIKNCVSISQLGTHDKIEHDASITRYDQGEGDRLNPQPELIETFLKNLIQPDQVNLIDYALRKSELNFLTFKPIKLKSKMIGCGEVGLTLSIFGNGSTEIESKALRTIFLEERLPDLWIKPKDSITVKKVLKISKNLNHLIQSIEFLDRQIHLSLISSSSSSSSLSPELSNVLNSNSNSNSNDASRIHVNPINRIILIKLIKRDRNQKLIKLSKVINDQII